MQNLDLKIHQTHFHLQGQNLFTDDMQIFFLNDMFQYFLKSMFLKISKYENSL